MLTRPDTIGDPQQDKRQLKRAFYIIVCFALFLWLIKIIEEVSGTSFSEYGIYPGTVAGLAGVLVAPMIHSSWSHLLANTAPVLILGTALLYGYPRAAKIVIPVIYLGTGICVWLFAREVHHIGASGLTFGAMFFVFTIGAIRWDRRAIALSMIVFFLYGSMIWGIFPTNSNMSYETHLFAAILGVLLAIFLRKQDPYMPEKRYDWEHEEEEESGEEKAQPG
jgi:membrane associated rhomboid family serine protease